MVRLSVFADEAGDSLKEQIDALVENGLAETDVRGINGKNVLAFEEAEAKAYGEELAAAGISVACIGSPLGKRDVCDYAEFEKDLDKILKTAEIFKTDRIRIFSFYHSEGKRAQVMDCLGQAVLHAKKYGVTLYHENEHAVYGERAAECKDLLDTVGCGCVFDPANFVLIGQDITEAEKLLLPYSDFYHVKDGRYTGDIVPAGYGDANVRELLKRDGVLLTIEPHLFEFGGLAGLTEKDLTRGEFVYKTQREAFDAGVTAVKNILTDNGFVKDAHGRWNKK
ncbi:MAG: TIM barrel protein [Clostridia bacterium]|nr:TIM barrel protein [Clostridia bacterium]